MKNKIILSLVMMASLVLPSCEMGLDFLNPAGKSQTVERPFNGAISKVVIDDDVDVTVYINATLQQKAVVTAGENIISGIKTEVSDSTITIKNTNSFEWTSSFKNKKEVTLYLNGYFSDLEYFGDGNVQVVDTIVAGSFLYHCSESSGEVSMLLIAQNLVVNQQSSVSDLHIAGSCNSAAVTYRGSGWIYLDQLVASNMNITSWGSGDTYVNATGTLTAQINSIGNVIYTGNPAITLNRQGSGNLIKH